MQSNSLQDLVREINDLDAIQIERYYREHWLHITSVRQVDETIPLCLLFYCVGKMVRDGREISGGSLQTECEGLLALLPLDFLDKLRPVERGGEEITLSGLETGRTAVALSVGSGRRQEIHGVSNDLRQGEGTHILVASSSSDFQTEHQNLSLPPNVYLSGLGDSSVQHPADGNDCVDKINVQRASLSTQDPSHLGACGFSNSTTRREADVRHEVKDSEQNENESMTHVRFLESLYAVKKENELLEVSRTCTLCKTNPRGVTFLPCGHFINCRACAGPVYVCSVCNRNILATVDTYLS